MEKETSNSVQLIQKTYRQFYDYVQQIVGQKKTSEFAQTSYRTILNYFRNLNIFRIDSGTELRISTGQLSENEIIAFSVWMFQFIKEMKNFMIGIGKVNPREITADLTQPLQEIGFYEYYDQAAQYDF